MFLGIPQSERDNYKPYIPRHLRTREYYYLNKSRKKPSKLFPTPDDLWQACCRYFQYVSDNPLLEQRAFHSNGVIKKTYVEKKRPMTFTAMRIFIGISAAGYEAYRRREEYQEITRTVDDIIRNQKFEGAAAGFFNAGFISKDLGMVEKTEMTGDISVTKKSFSDFYPSEKKEQE